jgi:hypothetical protein
MLFIPEFCDPVPSPCFQVKTNGFQLTVPTFAIRAKIREFFSFYGELFANKCDKNHD